MRFLKDNRYIYRIYQETKEKSGIKKIGCIPQFIKVLCGYKSWAWEYIEEIKKNGYVIHLPKYRDIKLFVPNFEFDGIQRLIVRNEDFYEANLLKLLKDKYIKENTVILDIGANIGNHTVFFSKVCKARKIFSFEPVEETYNILNKHVGNFG